MKINIIARSIRQLSFFLRKEKKVSGQIILMHTGYAVNENGEQLQKYCVHISNKNKGIAEGQTITLDKYMPDGKDIGEVLIIA